MYCFICEKEIDYSENVFPQLHLVKIHNITAKDYFDRYLKKDGEGICQKCGKETKFLGIGKTKRYRRYCSSKCSNSSESKKELTKLVLKEKYGDENFVNVQKMKETNLKRYGVDCTIHSEISKIKISNLRKKQRNQRILEKIKDQNLEIIDLSQNKFFKFKCFDCKNEFEIHNQTFYLRSLANVKICPICNPFNGGCSHLEKQLLDFIKQFYNIDKNIIICRLCHEKFESNFGLGKHITSVHKISTKEYYDSFIRNEKDGLCLNCGKETVFDGLNFGYRSFCSRQCASSNISIIEKRKNTNIEKYGYDSPLKNKEILEKSKETLIKNYGVDNPSKSSLIKIKKQKTYLEHYGVDNPSKSKDILILKSKKFEKVEDILKTNNIELLQYLENDLIECKCSFNHKFTIRTHYLYLKNRNNYGICPDCFPKSEISYLEKQLLDFIKQQKFEILENNRQIIKPYELDIYLPELKLAFEFNGLYWHNELNKPNDYHLNKTIACEKQGIHLVQIYEDDWVYKQDIVKSRILNLLGKSEKIPARKCEVREVSFKESKEFLEGNHLQSWCADKIRLGLYYNNKLVSLMTFGNLRKNLGQKSKDGLFELLRFCNKLNTSVIGGANKLFRFFLKNYQPQEVISYADRSWTMNNGNTLYDKLGFKLESITRPNYFYINNNIRENRFKYRKDILVKEGFDKNKTEHEIMLEREIYRIYNSGQLKYKYI